MEPVVFSTPRTLDDFNRIVVPYEVRVLLGVGPSEAVVFVAREGGIEVVRAEEADAYGSEKTLR